MATILALIAGLFPGLFCQNNAAAGLTLVDDGVFATFQEAKRIFVDTQKRIYVTDVHSHQVYIFENIGAQPKIFGGYGWTDNTFDTPTGIACDGINIFVSDYGNRRIQRFDRNANFISSWSAANTSDAAKTFGYPSGIGLSESGEYFILDDENKRIMKYSASGEYDRTFGDINGNAGKLADPLKLLCANSKVFVLEPDRLNVYDYFGNLVLQIGMSTIHDACGFCVTDQTIIIVSPRELFFFNQDGAKLYDIPLKNILSSQPLPDIQDVAQVDGKILLLSKEDIHRIFIAN